MPLTEAGKGSIGVYGDFIGIVEKKMETTIIIIGYILGSKRDNGKENGSYYLGFRVSGSSPK